MLNELIRVVIDDHPIYFPTFCLIVTMYAVLLVPTIKS